RHGSMRRGTPSGTWRGRVRMISRGAAEPPLPISPGSTPQPIFVTLAELAMDGVENLRTVTEGVRGRPGESNCSFTLWLLHTLPVTLSRPPAHPLTRALALSRHVQSQFRRRSPDRLGRDGGDREGRHLQF